MWFSQARSGGHGSVDSHAEVQILGHHGTHLSTDLWDQLIRPSTGQLGNVPTNRRISASSPSVSAQ